MKKQFDYVMVLFQITLRVKESEVQCLKQELTSLKDELQSAQRVRISQTASAVMVNSLVMISMT